jgi:hypothetical protein
VATTLLEKGMTLEQIQKFLGHAKLETTQIYAESTTEMIKGELSESHGGIGTGTSRGMESAANDLALRTRRTPASMPR